MYRKRRVLLNLYESCGLGHLRDTIGLAKVGKARLRMNRGMRPRVASDRRDRVSEKVA
jgi:hypothetical protein